MYCSSCGKSISDEEFQRNGAFCDNCAGSVATPQKPTPADETTPVAPKTYQVTPQRPIGGEGTGQYSKKSLIFGLLSIGFLIAGLIMGNMGRGYFGGYYYYYSSTMMLVNSITVTILHIVGLIFGVTAKKNKDRAKIHEPGNPMKTIGGIFGLNGIIFNAILMALAVIFLVIAIISIISSLLYFPYY